MRSLPLYPSVGRPPIDITPPLSLNPNCTRCRLYQTAYNRCLPADGTPGGLLVVGKHPGKHEDRQNRVHIGASGSRARRVTAANWKGPVVWDNATRCFPGANGHTEACINACRPYLKKTIDEARPTRIVAMGSDAVYALLGRSVPIMSVGGGYGFIRTGRGEKPIPVFFVIHPAAGERNAILAARFDQEMAAVLRAPDPALPPWDEDYYVVETVADAQYAAKELREEAPWFAYDIEAGGVMYGDYYEPVTVACCSSGTDTAYVWDRKALANPAVRKPLLDLLEDREVEKVGHNIKYDNNGMEFAYGIRVRGTRGDTRLWRRLLQADANGRLGVCDELVGMGGHKDEMDSAVKTAVQQIADARERGSQTTMFFGSEDPALTAAIKNPDEDPLKFAYALAPPEVRDRYCALDGIATARLGDFLEPKIEADKPIRHIWTRVVKRATPAIARMESWGIAADRGAIVSLDQYLAMEIGLVEQRLKSYGNFNPNSPDDIGRVLFDDIGLKPVKKTNGGKASTDKEALSKLQGQHPIIDDLIKHRKLSTNRKNYGLKMAGFIRADGRIHAELKIDGARTGRLSCVEPPLHILPRSHTEIGRMVKDAFIAPLGRKLLAADYSQVELRVAAMLSGDPVMIAMFQSGEDFHTATAKLIAPIMWGIKPEDVQAPHRSAAKAFNFGLIYGMTDRGLAQRLGCTLAEAKKLRAAIMGKWRVLAHWMDQRLTETRRTGYARTWWEGQPARRRPLTNIRSQDSLKRSNAENGSRNTPVQGTANDYMVASICDIVEWIERENIPAKAVLTIHDSIELDVANEAVMDVAGKVKEIMLGQDSGVVPLKVDLEWGESLGSLEALDIAA